MDRLTEMEAFAAVVDLGGFTDAARKMGISKSAVSKHVASLETRLGTRLLNRTTRRVAPTDVGLAYYDRARRLLIDAVEADAIASGAAATPRGELRLLVPAALGLAQVMPLTLGFLRAHPEVQLKIGVDDALNGGGFDVALRLEPATPEARVLASFRQRLVAAPQYLQQHGRPLRVDDLADHALLHAAAPGEPGIWRLETPNGERREVLRGGPVASREPAALLAAAREGLGIARLPGYLVGEDLERGALQEVLADLPAERCAIVARIDEGVRPVPARISVFLAHLAAGFAEHGAAEW